MEDLKDEAQEQLVNSAFIGWQVISALGGSKVPMFQKYAKNLGVLKATEGMMDKADVDDARRKSRENTKRAIEAFQKGVVRQ